MSRSTRSIPTNSAPSPAGAISDKVLAGIDAAQAAGLKVKINAVALKGVNEDEIRAVSSNGRMAAAWISPSSR